MSVIDRQEELFFKRCLIRQRELFSSAKNIQCLRYAILLIIGLLSIFGPVCFSEESKWPTIFLVVTGFMMILQRFLDWLTGMLARRGALLRQYADIWLFGSLINIDRSFWGESLSDCKACEWISSIDEKDKRIHSFDKWYVVQPGLSAEAEIFVCQRINLRWDRALHILFNVTFVLIWLLILTSIVVLTWHYSKTSCICATILVAVTYLDLIVDLIVRFISDAQNSRNLLNKSDRIGVDLCTGKTGDKVVHGIVELQSSMLKYRAEQFLIPDWYYNLWKGVFERRAIRATTDFVSLRRS